MLPDRQQYPRVQVMYRRTQAEMPAIGSRPADRIVSTTDGIDTDEKGYVITSDYPMGMTTRRGVFAGGDVVHRPE